jgi:hypothetical protein
VFKFEKNHNPDLYSELRTDRKSAKIIELRNRLGAHKAGYLQAGEGEEPDFYGIAMTSIDKWGFDSGFKSIVHTVKLHLLHFVNGGFVHVLDI